MTENEQITRPQPRYIKKLIALTTIQILFCMLMITFADTNAPSFNNTIIISGIIIASIGTIIVALELKELRDENRYNSERNKD